MMFSDDNVDKDSHIDVDVDVDDGDDDIENADPAEGEQSQERPNTGKAPRESKNKRRNKKKKRRAKQRQAEVAEQREKQEQNEKTEEKAISFDDVEVEYIQDTLNLDPKDPMYDQFLKIFKTFQLSEPDHSTTTKVSIDESTKKIPKDIVEEEEEEPEEGKKDDEQKLSKRKQKQLSRLSIAELKQNVSRPDVVEMHDVTAKDPKLLVQLKAARNTVPVPRHWCFKRKYLQGKRGIEKPPFNLPDFIKRTGIMEMRQALQEKEEQKTLKTKMKEKVRPKLGKIDIDYQKLHDAFFRWQTKPLLTKHGDLYYEGKEFETRLHEKKPGELSDDLRTALGMPAGQSSQNVPPPWLIAVQRYGPPPSYPNLKVPGLNCPIPEGCSYGYHAGGWGKPPVDETGRPLYGDVFGTDGEFFDSLAVDEDIDRTLWGEYESEPGSDSDDDEEEQGDDGIDESGLVTPIDGLDTPSGIESIPAGMETPDLIELRKKKIESEMEGKDIASLYTILPEKKVERVGAAVMGSTHTYDLAAAIPGNKNVAALPSTITQGRVEVALDPSELNMDASAMAARYEQTIREQQSHLAKEDLSDMVAEHSAKQNYRNKRKNQADSSKNERGAKKYKEFKF